MGSVGQITLDADRLDVVGAHARLELEKAKAVAHGEIFCFSFPHLFLLSFTLLLYPFRYTVSLHIHWDMFVPLYPFGYSRLTCAHEPALSQSAIRTRACAIL